jgi:gamma-glutamylcysteine synthetase
MWNQVTYLQSDTCVPELDQNWKDVVFEHRKKNLRSAENSNYNIQLQFKYETNFRHLEPTSGMVIRHAYSSRTRNPTSHMSKSRGLHFTYFVFLMGLT